MLVRTLRLAISALGSISGAPSSALLLSLSLVSHCVAPLSMPEPYQEICNKLSHAQDIHGVFGSWRQTRGRHGYGYGYGYGFGVGLSLR
jgi:hypothetical protein